MFKISIRLCFVVNASDEGIVSKIVFEIVMINENWKLRDMKAKEGR